MPTLSSSIVKQRIASMRDVEEALARQVLYGGDLATNLLELAAVSEPELTGLLAESHGLEPAPVGELPVAPEAALRMVPGDLALRHGLFPLSHDKGVLAVAVSEPLPAEVEQDLGFALGVTIQQRSAPLVRVRQAISRDYGLPMDRRTLRLVAKLEGRPDPSPSSMPGPRTGADLMPGLPRPPSLPPLGAADTELSATEAEPTAAAPEPAAPEAEPPAAAPEPAAPEPEPAAPEAAAEAEAAEPAAPEAAAEAEAEPAAPEPEPAVQQAAAPAQPEPSRAEAEAGSVAVEPTPSVPVEPTPAPKPPPAAPIAESSTEAPVEPTPAPVPPPAAPAAPEGPTAGRVRAALGAVVRPASRRPRRRRLGPYTAAMAEQDLLEAETRDDVLRAFFDFASQYFEYSAVFALHGDIAEGWDAHGPGADSSRIAGIGVPLDLPSALSAARDAGSWQLVKLSTEGLDASLSKDLDRKARRLVLLLPIMVRKRCVLLLYGDHGDRDVQLDAVGDVIAFAPLVSSGIERVILKRKLSARRELRKELIADAVSVPGARKKSSLPSADERKAALAALVEQPGKKPAKRPSIRPSAQRAEKQPPAGHEQVAKPSVSDSGAVKSPAAERSQAQRSPKPAAAAKDVAKGPKQPVAAAKADSTVPSTDRAVPKAKASIKPPRATPAARPAAESQPPRTRASSPNALRQKAESPAGAEPSSPAAARVRTPPQGTPIRHDSGDEQRAFPLTTRSSPPPPVDEPPEDGWDVEAPADDREKARRSHTTPGVAPPSNPPATPPSKPASRRLELVAEEGPEISVGEEVEIDPAMLRLTEEVPLAPSSRSVAYPAQRLRKRFSSKELKLPSVIVDHESDARELVNLLLGGDPEAGEALVQIGAPAIMALVSVFPGPITREPARGGNGPSKASTCGPVLATLARIGQPAVQFIIPRSADTDPTVRAWATRLLGELPSVDSAQAVVPRLLETNQEVRRAALAAARLLQTDDEASMALRDGLLEVAASKQRSSDARHAALEAIADVRDPLCVGRLVRLLGDSASDIVRSAHWALVVMTRQDFGKDQEAWASWWEENSSRHRIEWLIDALMHDSADIRRAAGDELKALTKEYFGYYDDLPKKERARAQERYREWWDSKGKARFSRVETVGL